MLDQDPAYADLVAQHASVITPENETKWLVIHPSLTATTLGPVDELAAWAQAEGMKMRGHPLIWHWNIPQWVRDMDPDREEAIAIMRDHIFTVVGHFREEFPGLVTEWDVVNEPIGNDAALRNSDWRRWIGDDYIDLAFRFAREAAGPG